MPKKKPLKFSIPYNNDFGLLEGLARIRNLNGNRIEEIYLSPPQEYAGSGRVVARSTKKDLVRVLAFCRANGLGVNLLLNSQCEGLGGYAPRRVNKVLDLVKEMHEKHGLDSLTVADPFFILKIREALKEIKITVSVRSAVDSVQRALFFKDFGADVLTTDREINRDLGLLKRIKEATGCRLKLMVNEGCLFRCPMRIYHDNWTSHASRRPEIYVERLSCNLFKDWCREIRRADRSQLLKSPWIRPEDLRKYSGITDFFKLVGRVSRREYILGTAMAYMSESYDGSIEDLINPFQRNNPCRIDNKKLKGFFERVAACDKNCAECGYCGELAEKLVRQTGAER